MGICEVCKYEGLRAFYRVGGGRQAVGVGARPSVVNGTILSGGGTGEGK
jgi:hypothetical protein